jgi:hypothetical protein
MNRLMALFAVLALTAGIAFVDRNPVSLQPQIKKQSDRDAFSQQQQPPPQPRQPLSAPAFTQVLSGGQPGAIHQETGTEPSGSSQSAGTDNPPKWTDEVQAVSAAIVMVLTVVLACVNYIQTGHVRNATKAAERAAKAAERALDEYERPWLFVTVEPNLVGFSNPSDMLPAVVFTVLNGGRFPAEIEECHANLTQSIERDFGVIRDALHTVIGHEKPISGMRLSATDPFVATAYPPPFGDAYQFTPVASSEYETFFCIKLRYRGIGKNIYESEFSWRWDHSIGTWSNPISRRT